MIFVPGCDFLDVDVHAVNAGGNDSYDTASVFNFDFRAAM